jgi:minor extracellular serine protease Vpr
MRGSPSRGRSMLVLTALAAALAIPAAVSAAAGTGQLTPLVSPPSPSSSGATGGQSPDIFLVQLSDSADTFRKEAKAVGLKYTERYAYKSLFRGVSVRIAPSDVGKLAGIASVSRVYPAHYYTLGPEPAADPELATAIQMTGADIAQAEGYTGEGVKVAVMDTGIDVDHPDLGGDGNAAAPHSFPNSRIIGGWDFVGDDYNADPESATYDPVPQPDSLPDDCNGHGTHVAGIVGADKSSGSDGALGVAPKASFGAYRVFGCTGSVTDDVMIAAMERIKADGMDVLNMSIGDAFNNWAGTPTAAAADALVDAGIVVVASIGNSGANGIYSAGAPGVGDKVIGVASYDNSHVRLASFTISPDNTAIGYTIAASSPAPPTSGSLPMSRTGTTATANDACNAVAPAAGSLTGTAVLIRRGTCTFYEKARNAQLAGAAAVVLYNNCPPNCGRFSPTVAIQAAAGTPLIPITIPVVAISDTEGALINGRLASGPVTLTWTAGTVTAVNPTGGLISSFSSYGTEAELNLKPDIGAPGGLIRSTYPLEQPGGGYATISGTSMSSPHVAGAAALLMQAHPSLPAAAFRSVLQNSADPHVWSLNPGLGLLDNVHRQGAGMVDIDDAINATTAIVPGKLSLGESQAGPATRTLTLTSNANASVTYDLSHVEAVGTSGTFPANLGFWLPDTQVVFSAPSVTVPAHGTATVNVTVTADPNEDNLPTGGLYGGYLVFTDASDAESVFGVPYAGFKGDYQSIVAIPTAPVIGKLNGPPFIKAQQTYAQAAAGHHWTLQSPDEVPNVLIHFDHQVRHLELQVVDAATGVPVHPVFSNIVERDFVARNGLRPPPGGPYNTDANTDDVTAFPWDGTRMHDNGVGTPDHRKVVPDGSYKVVVKALKAAGDPKNPAHWETWTTPTIIIDRP